MSWGLKVYDTLPKRAQLEVRKWYVKAYFFKKRVSAFYFKRRNTGAGTKVDKDALILGWRNIRLGKSVMISAGVVINVNNRDDQVRVRIDDFAAINKDCFFVNGDSIILKEYSLLGPGCRFLGGNHVFDSPMAPYIASGNTNKGSIILGVNCWLGAGVTILGDVHVGHGSVIGANSFVLSNIPPFSIVVGNPAQVRKRYSPILKRWVQVSEFTLEDEALIPSEAEYLAGLKAAFPWIAMPFAASGPSRGDLA